MKGTETHASRRKRREVDISKKQFARHFRSLPHHLQLEVKETWEFRAAEALVQVPEPETMSMADYVWVVMQRVRLEIAKEKLRDRVM